LTIRGDAAFDGFEGIGGEGGHESRDMQREFRWDAKLSGERVSPWGNERHGDGVDDVGGETHGEALEETGNALLNHNPASSIVQTAVGLRSFILHHSKLANFKWIGNEPSADG